MRREPAVGDSVIDGPVLETRGIEVDFGNGTDALTVLNGLDIQVDQGEFLTVMGPSGCGKSTLLNVLAGFLPVSRGEVVCGRSVVKGPGSERGVVLQSPALYPWMSVLDNVLFGPRAMKRKDDSTERAREFLAEVGLGGFESRRPYELSGGMQHRVAMVRALVNEPAVLLMDEPFAALDAQTRSEMQDILLGVWERHRMTVVFVTHDIEEGLLLANRVIVLTQRPAEIRAHLTVDLPRPRSSDAVLEPAFIELRAQVLELLRRNESNEE